MNLYHASYTTTGNISVSHIFFLINFSWHIAFISNISSCHNSTHSHQFDTVLTRNPYIFLPSFIVSENIYNTVYYASSISLLCTLNETRYASFTALQLIQLYQMCRSWWDLIVQLWHVTAFMECHGMSILCVP